MGGTMYNAIMSRAGEIPFVREYFAGRLARDVFQRSVSTKADELSKCGLDTWQIDLLRRMPIDENAAVKQLLSSLVTDGVLNSPVPREAEFDTYREMILRDFDHLPTRYTSIFPEETRIAYELSSALEPKSIFVAGSYYAYLAVWMIPGLSPGGSMVCLDPDSDVSDLARRNMIKLGFEDRVTVRAEDAVKVLAEDDSQIDLLFVDAYGPSTNEPAFRGKSIYGPIVRAALPRMKRGSVVMAHNADRESSSLDDFFDALKNSRWSVFLDTTEHLAVFGL